MADKPLDSIEESDLQSLVENQVLEKKTLEYKQELPGHTVLQKKKFLEHISSFANAVGGLMIYGIRADEGVPVEVCGLQNLNVDEQKLRLEQMIRDGIAPRIPNIRIRALTLQNGYIVILIRVPKSWNQPHMITFQSPSRFFSRTSAGKYPLDVREIRTAFIFSETIRERIRNFLSERLANIVADQTPMPLIKNPKTILHIIPVGAFDPASRFDIASLDENRSSLAPIHRSSYNHRYNFDGFLTFSQFPNSAAAHSYTQTFYNGIIEAVDAYLIHDRDTEGNRVFSGFYFETKLLETIPGYLSAQNRLGVEPPLVIMLSLIGVKGTAMVVNGLRSLFAQPRPIDRDTLIVPEVLVDTYDCNVPKVMRPIFNAVWNAAGRPRSMSYDEHGEWRPRR